MHITLWEGYHYASFPETPVNLLVEVAFYRKPVISIQHPDAKLKIE
jgi:hypothetical protein